MKKFFIMNISVFLILVISISLVAKVNANNIQFLSDLEIVDLITVDLNIKNETVSRIDCLTTLLNAVGVTNYAAMHQNKSYGDNDELSDIDLEWHEKWAWYGYLKIACVNDIAYGEPYENKFIFNGKKDTTAGACIAFMMRMILDDSSADLKSAEILYESAKSLGLININDNYYNDMSHNITVLEYKELLGRFLVQDRYKYYANPNSEYYPYLERDEKRSMSYLEFLNTSKTWVNTQPVHNTRTVIMTCDSLDYLYPLIADIDNIETVYPLKSVCNYLSQFGIFSYTNVDNSLTISYNGNNYIVFSNSNKMVQNGNETALEVQTRYDDKSNEIFVSEEVINIIFDNRFKLNYYFTKMYLNITLTERVDLDER